MFARRLFHVLGALLIASTLLLAPVQAETRRNFAILVGVSDYPSIAKESWLQGPRNDMELVRGFLASNPAVAFQPDDIVVLADGLEGAAEPTLANIRAAFAAMAGEGGQGGFI